MDIDAKYLEIGENDFLIEDYLDKGVPLLLDNFYSMLDHIKDKNKDSLLSYNQYSQDELIKYLVECGKFIREDNVGKTRIKYSDLSMDYSEYPYYLENNPWYLDLRPYYESYTGNYLRDISDIPEKNKDLILSSFNELRDNSQRDYGENSDKKHVVLRYVEYVKEYNISDNDIKNYLLLLDFHGEAWEISRYVLGKKRMSELEIVLLQKWNRVF